MSIMERDVNDGRKYHTIFNFRERQRQLEELTKELTRVTDETEVLKAKLRSLAKQVRVTEVRQLHLVGEICAPYMQYCQDNPPNVFCVRRNEF